ncbi:amidase domain-containing protein [Metabacillus litoralis]|uniref:amidase domain-containing protein n=1 Tax=Metabacillus litoralis TaxID=152268 RepID=UPI00203D4D95|nr:amidase domain-containing protein [Metabacillus litoralis]MCM3410066.1 amidase domain-containing protein [Metabacillus litoralis]
MKKILTLSFSLIFICVLFGFSHQTHAKEFDSYTIGEIEQKLLNYFEEGNIDIEIGSEEFIDYLVLQLLEDKDENLAKHPDYELILFYAGEYLYELENAQAENPEEFIQTSLASKKINKEKFNLKHISKKTIKQIKKEIKEQDEADKALEEEVEAEKNKKGKNKNKNSDVSSLSDSSATKTLMAYSGTNAANYAKQWATKTNPNFNRYPYNCTNFVSQAVNAGGKAERKPSSIPSGDYATTSYWYNDAYYACTGSNSCYWRKKAATSWIRVIDFYSYWTKQGMSAVTSSSQSTIISNAIVGDVVQFRKSDGRWFHSVLVNRKANGTIYIASNTSDYYDKNFKNTSENMYRVIKMR